MLISFYYRAESQRKFPRLNWCRHLRASSLCDRASRLAWWRNSLKARKVSSSRRRCRNYLKFHSDGNCAGAKFDLNEITSLAGDNWISVNDRRHSTKRNVMMRNWKRDETIVIIVVNQMHYCDSMNEKISISRNITLLTVSRASSSSSAETKQEERLRLHWLTTVPIPHMLLYCRNVIHIASCECARLAMHMKMFIFLK